jgi:putative two-component system response regulator
VDGGEEGLGEELGRLAGARNEDPLLPAMVLLRGEPAPDLVALATQPGVVIRSGSATIRSAEMHVRKLLGIRSMLMEQAQSARQLRAQLTAQEALLDEAHADIVLRLAWAAEYRDDVTGHHAHRVGVLAGLIAGEMGINEQATALIAGAAPLHDLGKIAIPDGLLRKPGALSPDERQQMMEHARLGSDVLAGSRHPLLREAELIARSHHEWWDGNGYPDGLRGERIPVSARIVAVADVFDSLTHDRPYRRALGREETLQYIKDGRGAQFDPAVVDALLRVIASGAVARVDATDVVAWPDAAGKRPSAAP